MNLIILGFIVLFLLTLIRRPESYSDYHVNYPYDAYPDDNESQFLVKLPYDSLTTRHYKKMYYNKTTPKCVVNGTCEPGPGYYKSYPDYFDNPTKLKSYSLGYSITGFPYNDYKFTNLKSMKNDDLKHPTYAYEYPKWYDYDNPRKEAYYYGYPFYFHGHR